MGQHKSNMNVMDHNWALKPQFGPLGNRKEKACAADINNFVTLHHNSPFPKFLILPFLSEPSITLTRSYIRSSTVALSNNHNTIFITWSPDTSRVRSKMIYASSKDRFKRELDGIQVELQATDPTEMGLDVFKSRAN
ncbi:uncharacterized protein LOC114388048 isoform X2 [Glycine soja]|uniref:actin depolymerizing factor 1 isoform X1 n=1 Tax=Glycine max TaxID=3847 RepID=UPI000E21B817|nr:uncharacterized protein LOC100305514 isoform X1 [Glycine max]XP_028204183.1 uncharacterized protein LOC114388048 isoform X2 [Glycine soja]|eukprot:XP_014622803.2 uncharacterized protein LOC100305514 isoform X1 [Glycine max]